jgi:predicted DNA-binding WGR domain protein
MRDRYEYVGGSSRKFWEIEKPRCADGKWGDWLVTVVFGRIGTAGQSHTKVFGSKWTAESYYSSKVSEKVGKGYVPKGKIATVSPKLQQIQGSAIPQYVVPKVKPKPACAHPTLTRKGNTYECAACKSKVEFDKPQASTVQVFEIEQQVRRYFARAGE